MSRTTLTLEQQQFLNKLDAFERYLDENPDSIEPDEFGHFQYYMTPRDVVVCIRLLASPGNIAKNIGFNVSTGTWYYSDCITLVSLSDIHKLGLDPELAHFFKAKKSFNLNKSSRGICSKLGERSDRISNNPLAARGSVSGS